MSTCRFTDIFYIHTHAPKHIHIPMRICIFTYIHTCMAYTSMRTRTYMCTHMIHISCTCIYIYMHIHIHIYGIYIYTYLHIHPYTYTSICICIYMHMIHISCHTSTHLYVHTTHTLCSTIHARFQVCARAPHMKESCQTYGRVMSYMGAGLFIFSNGGGARPQHVKCMNESCRTYE